MMAASFGYTKKYVKELSLLDVYGHITYYMDNPPAGTMIKSIVTALFGKGTEKQVQQDSDDLDNLISDFAGAGGLLK